MSNEVLRETANKLVAFCREGREREGLATLYDPSAVSVEAMAASGMPSAELRGVEAIQGKHDWWTSAHEVHDQSVEGPFLHGDDRFAVIFALDLTNRESGERGSMKEVAIYAIDPAGKIVREEFYYG